MVAESKWPGYISLFFWLFISYFFIRYFFSPKVVVDVDKLICGEKLYVPANFLARIPLQHVDPMVSGVVAKKALLVSTENCLYKFFEDSAALVSVKYKNIKDKLGFLVDSVEVTGGDVCASFIFLPQLNDVSPIFSIDKKEEFDDIVNMVFKAEYQGWVIYQKYVFEKNSFKFDIEFEFHKIEENALPLDSARLVFCAPRAGSFDEKNSTLFGFVNDKDLKNVVKISVDSFENTAWQTPYLFGAENRFFVHAFLGDASGGSIKRAYFSKTMDATRKNISLEFWPIFENKTMKMEFFVGPKKVNYLVAAREDLGNVITFGFLGWFYKFVLDVLEKLCVLFGNYGVSLIILAFLLRLAFLPLVIFSKKKTLFLERFQTLHAGELAEINRRFANNFTLRTEALNKFYSERGVSQLGNILTFFTSVFQVIIVLGLYRVLANYISLFNAPFIFWIKDLSVKDPYFVFPVLIGVVQFFHQRIISANSNKDFLVGPQGFLFKYVSPVVMIIIFSALPSGAALFWLFNSFFASVEEIWLRKYFFS